jgi:flagellar hook-associated protein 2
MSTITGRLKGYIQTGGTLQVKIDNLTKRNKQIDDQIDSMQTRIDKYKETLQAQYSAMETTISGLKSQGNSLSSILSQSS